MEKFSFFNSINGDRASYAEDFARHLKKYFTNGIFNNELKVIANNDMTITCLLYTSPSPRDRG